MSGRDVITNDGVRLRTRVDGPSGAPSLLLCNSLGTGLSIWDGQLDGWSSRHRVVRFDQRGHGASQAPPGPYDVACLGRDALAVLDAHGVDRADVCGLSLGGLVALWVAAHAPERVRRLVLADTAARIGTEDGWRTRAATVRTGGMPAVVDAVLERFFSPGFRRRGGPEVASLARDLRNASVDGYAGSCEALAVADLRAQAPTVHTPTLVVVGTHDVATPPADARALQRLLPDARLHEIEGAGHLANLEAPEEFTRIVGDFLA